MSPSGYPSTLDTLPVNKGDTTVQVTDHKDHHNNLADAVNKIEAELGVAPSGTVVDVVTRLDAFVGHSHVMADITDFSASLAAKLDTSVITTSGKGFKNHAADANAARPAGFASVEWLGAVEPVNALNGDTWVDTTI